MATVTDRWEEFDSTSRTGIVIGTIVILAATLAALLWLLREENQVLFSGMTPQDAAAVVAELERQKLDYALAEGGTKILVPGSEVHSTRLKLMGSGMPMSGGVGFELFDDSDFGMTEFAQRINYQRAMQGELARTIMALDEVRHARIHLVMPEGGLFQREEETPTASVNLVLQGDARLSPAQVMGVQRLVAAAVQGLEPSQVTILDQQGVTLSKSLPADEESAAASTQLARKQEVEAYLAGKVDAVLAHWLGAGQAAVSVDVSLNMNQVRRTLESVMPQPDGNGIVTLKRESRNWGGDGEVRKDGAVTTETQYDMGRQVEQIVEMPGSIRRLSVGVLVSAELAQDELAQLEQLVSMAVGLDLERGDSMVMHALGGMPPAPMTDESELQNAYSAQPVSGTNAPAADTSATERVLARLGAGDQEIGPLPLAAWLLIAVGLLLLWSVFVTWRYASARRGSAAPGGSLSADERAAVAEQIREWLAADERAAPESAT